jgi:nucleoside-diphosphate-sugar epimerase
MILVVGATGLLGSEICSRLRRQQVAVRALVRPTANEDRLAALRRSGAELCVGDLKDPESVRKACEGVEVVISTASSTLSGQDRDSIETVDRLGQLSLIEKAHAAGVKHFTLVSIPCCRFSLIARTPTLIGKEIPLSPTRRISLNLKNYPLICRKSGARIVTNFLALKRDLDTASDCEDGEWQPA